MVGTQFQAILKEFESFFNCSLVSDQNESCIIKMGIGLEVQIEINRYGLLIGSRLGQLSGRYSELIFKQALKANSIYPPSTGSFGYSQKSGNLILFMFLNPQIIRADTLSDILTPFVLKAKTWKDAIQNEEIPVLQSEEASSSSPGRLFGL